MSAETLTTHCRVTARANTRFKPRYGRLFGFTDRLWREKCGYLTLALIFGFVAKEVVIGSLAVIYGLNAIAVSGHIAETVTFIQGYSFCIFCLLYTPCLTTVATLWNESKSWKFTLFSLAFFLVLAWVASFGFYQTALLLGFR